MDSGQHARIRAIAAILGLLAFLPVALRLYWLMVERYDYYAQKALRNQSRTTAVAADRGRIYDRNMNILADSQSVEYVYLNPHELKQARVDIPAMAQKLGQILELDPQWIEKQAADRSMRYKLLKAKVSRQTAG
jgi:stage V sporulation protein D (sporulation-specific penicillin-binding protein)